MTVKISKDVKLNRNQYIGGSDIAVVMGMSRWKTPLKLWAEKTGKLAIPDLSNVEAVELGTELEQFVADMFTKKANKVTRKAPKVYQHKEYSYMVAHIDRLITGTDELLECKTCSIFKQDEWVEDEIPQEYILQVMWYLGITGRKTGYIACLIGGQKFTYKKIDFDQDLFNSMVESAKQFWSCVENDVLPNFHQNADNETFKYLYAAPTEIIKEANNNEEINSSIERLNLIKEEISKLEEEQKSIEVKLKAEIANDLGIATDKFTVTWKSQARNSIDTTLLKKQRPEIAEEYKKTSTTRVMRITENKEVA